jgi:serine phosphatase RsbU (regulator of sigma subunit)
VGLRSLPLARRFNVNYILTRSIPWFLSTVTLIAVVILGYGLHKAAEARKEMEGSLARATTAAALLLDDVPFDAAVTQARLALAEDAPGSALILRRGETKTTASAPESLIAHPAFEDDRLLTAAGLLIVEGRLYLVAREREAGASAIPGSAEVWIPIDPTYLGRFSERALVDVELRAMPSVRLGSVVVSFTDEKGMEAAVTVRSPDVAPSFGRGLFIRKFPISRLFLPIGNWRETEEGSPRGAVGMTLRGSLYQAIMAFQRNPYLMTSNVVPLLILGALGILTAIVEGISLRTGRSIVKTVLDDVQALESGAKLIGSGDLDHRIPVPGKDELSKLAGALNTMAADLKQQREELVDKERLEADLEVARSIQQRLLPQGSPIVAGADVAGVSIPSRVVGGDLFYFLPFEEGRLGLAVGDVSGKSVPAALLMSNVLAVLRAEAQIGVAVDESLSRINRLIAEQVEPNRFVTLFYGVVDRPSETVRYASAGHNPPLILRADGTAVWLHHGGTPLGVVADTKYRAATERFTKGDVLVLYSDGVTEAEAESASEQLFGESRLVDAVAGAMAKARSATATEILEAVLESLHRFTGGQPASDDRTLVVVRAT